MQAIPSPSLECVLVRDGDKLRCTACGSRYPFVAGRFHAQCKSGLEQEAKPIVVEDSPVLDAPSFLQKAKNFAKAAVSHIAAGMPLASDEEIDRRFAICQSCPFLKDNACTKCGCPVAREKKFISKLAWADQKCPEGHW